MQHLAGLLLESLTRVSVPSCLAAACRTHVPCASSIRLAVWAADDVLAITGNLVAEGSLALQLLPGTSATGLCAASASPRLVDGHAVHSRYIQLLTALAAALAETLPGAAASLRQNLAMVLNAKPQAAPDTKATAAQGRHDAPSSQWGRGSNSHVGRHPEAAAPTSGMANSVRLGFGGGSGSDADSEAGSDDSISAIANVSDAEHEPFLDLNFCAQQMQLDASCSPADSPPAATPPETPSPLTTPPPPAKAAGTTVAQAAEAPAGKPTGSPWTCKDFSCSSAAAGDDSSKGDAISEDVAELKAALHDRRCTQPVAPATGQQTRTVDGAAYLQWHAVSSYNLDVAVLALLLINVLAKGARPPAWLFWTMPLPSLTFAAVNAACLLLALLSPTWYKWRQAAMLALWAALVFISVSYAWRAPTLEYSEPGALAKPMWAARAFALETTMVGPVAMRLRYGVAVPLVLLHFACAAATAPHVCAASVFAAVSLRTCNATAWMLQVVFCLALPLLLCRWLDARCRQQFRLQASPAAAAAVGTT